MAHVQELKEGQQIPSCDAYFETIQSRKKLPPILQESLTAAFAQIPASSFPGVPGGKVIEIRADASVADAVKILSKSNILSAPVVKEDATDTKDWKERYLGVIDYSAVVLWVLESAELAAAAITASSAAAAGVGAGTVGALGAVALGATGPAAIVGLTAAAVAAAVAGGAVADKGMGRDAPTAAGHLGDDFYKVILQEEPFKSTKVGGLGFLTFRVTRLNLLFHLSWIFGLLVQVSSIVKSFRSTPFLPVATDGSMLTVLLLLSKYRLRNVPVIEPGKPSIKNFITQSAVVQGLEGCKGRDWFDIIAAHPISDLGLPFMSCDDVIGIQSNDLILEAFKRMKDYEIGGLPVVEGPGKKIVGNISMRDIKYLLLNPELFSNLRQLKVKDFITTIASQAQEVGQVVPPITCKLNSTLGSVIHTLASKSVHRIYVVAGEEDEVVGVITLRDVISCFIYEPPNHFDNYYGFSV
ncbi:SNF1- protein kinase regulatory subunit gamma-1-like [Dionaea muscipula]